MGKVIIELVSNYYSITGNANVDTVLFAIAASFAFAVAFNIVGFIFDALGFYDSSIMSDAHWTIRVAVFIVITWVFNKIFMFVSWLFSFSWWVYLITALFLGVLIISIFYLRHRISKDNMNQNQNMYLVENSSQPTVIMPTNESRITLQIRDLCPRCSKRLVKRNGPYGLFWGCDGFPSCRYSRKFK